MWRNTRLEINEVALAHWRFPHTREKEGAPIISKALRFPHTDWTCGKEGDPMYTLLSGIGTSIIPGVGKLLDVLRLHQGKRKGGRMKIRKLIGRE